MSAFAKVRGLRWIAFLCLAVWLGAAAAAPAGPAAAIAGQDAPRFLEARALWLADDEARALPALAGLAAEGNRAAQFLLALIDVTPAYQGPWLVARSRAERIALMRAPGGLSGQSWLAAAAEDTALARLRLAVQRPDATAATATALAAIGEDRAAREALQALSARNVRGFAAIADDPRYPPDLRHLVWREWAATPAGRARAEAEMAALMPGDPQIGRFKHRLVAPADRDAWLARAQLAAPLRAACATCPDDPVACTRAAFALIKGHSLLAEFGTPSETLIPPEVWNGSPRGRLTLLRVANARDRFGYVTFAQVSAEDHCLAERLGGEVARLRGG